MIVYVVLPGSEAKRNELSNGEVFPTRSTGAIPSVCAWLSLYSNLAQVYMYKLNRERHTSLTLLCNL